MTLNIIIIILLFTLIFICLLIFHKARRSHLFLYNIKQQNTILLENNYRQIEALIGLYQTLPLDLALPPLRDWAGSPDYLSILAQEIIKKRPETIVECGSGASSLIIGACLKKLGKGHCYSLDHNLEYAQKTREALTQQGLSEFVTIIDAPLMPISINSENWNWYTLTQLTVDKIDLLNIDGPPMDTGPLARYPAIPLLLNRLAENAVIILDDAGRPDERAAVSRWQNEFNLLNTVYLNTEKGLTICRLSGRGFVA